MDPTENVAVPEAPTTEAPAPAADQPEAPVTEAPAAVTPGTSEQETPEAPVAEATADESFTDLKVDDLPPELADRAKQMQADYTRKTQALAERHQELDQAVSFVSDLVSDESNATQLAVFKTLAERLGYDIEGDDEPTADEGAEPGEPEDQFRDPRLDPIIAEREADAQAAAAQAHEDALDAIEATIDTGIADLAKADGIDLSEHEQSLIFDAVLALPPLATGPNVQGAYDRYKAATQAHTDRWVKSKKSTTAPGGDAAATPVNLNNEDERLAHMARAAEGALRAESGI